VLPWAVTLSFVTELPAPADPLVAAVLLDAVAALALEAYSAAPARDGDRLYHDAHCMAAVVAARNQLLAALSKNDDARDAFAAASKHCGPLARVVATAAFEQYAAVLAQPSTVRPDV